MLRSLFGLALFGRVRRKPRVLLHIGAPKAGSTTIQSSLGANAELLASQNILYWEPSSAKGGSARTFAGLFFPDDRRLVPNERLHFASRSEARAWSQSQWDELHRRVGEMQPDLTVLSSEFLFNLPDLKGVMRELGKSFGEVHVLGYLRHPLETYCSNVDQMIRMGTRFNDLPLPDEPWVSLSEEPLRYRGLLPRGRVVMRNMARQNLVGQDLIADLAAQISRVAGREIALPAPVDNQNESLCAAAALWLLQKCEGFSRFSQGGDRDEVLRWDSTVKTLRRLEGLEGRPKLSLKGTELGEWIPRRLSGIIGTYNEAFLKGQLPLARGEGEALPLQGEALRGEVRKWLDGQASAEEIAGIDAMMVARLPHLR